jgi:hypothetical protein
MKNSLLNTGYWTETAVDMPSGGYKRLALKMSESVFGGLGDLSTVRTVDPGGSSSRAIAHSLSTLDLTRYSTDLIPAPGNEGQNTPRDRPLGPIYGLKDQIDAVWAFGSLYVYQGSVIPLVLNYKKNMYAWEAAYKMEVRARRALEAWRENLEFCLSQPIHMVVSILKSAYQTGSVRTYHGTKDVLWHTGTPRVRSSNEETGLTCNLDLVDYIIKEAVMDYTSADKPVCWGVDDLVSEEARPSSEEEEKADKQAKAVGDKVLTVGQLARTIRSLGHIADLWPAIASKLNWGSLSVDLGEFNQAGADFILTDGIDFGASPFAGMLGARQVLAAGNARLSGFGRRVDESFNTKEGEQQQVWMIPIEGYQGSTTGPAMYSRSYIPTGMWMGEPDVDRRYGAMITVDDTGEQMMEFYNSKSPRGYVKEGYGLATPLSKASAAIKSIAHVTGWESYVVANPTNKDIEVALAYMYPDMVIATESSYYYRSRFHHRVPVFYSLRGDWEFYDEMGAFKFNLKQDGWVSFDDEVSINVSGSALQALPDGVGVGANSKLREVPAPELPQVEGLEE